MTRINADGSVFFGVKVSEALFEKIERVRTTEKGTIPRNEFVKTAINKLIEQTEGE